MTGTKDTITKYYEEYKEYFEERQNYIVVDGEFKLLKKGLREACASRFCSPSAGDKDWFTEGEYVIHFTYNDCKNKDSVIKFYDWLINESPMSCVFEPMTGYEAVECGGFILNMDDVDQLLFGLAIKASRFPCENGNTCDEIYKLHTDYNIPYPVAISYGIDISDTAFNLRGIRDIGHSFLDGNNLSFLIGSIKPSGITLKDNRGYSGTDNYDSNKSKTEIDKALKKGLESLPAEERKIGQCPFTKKVLMARSIAPKDAIDYINKWWLDFKGAPV